jgi:MFS transporter, UMF1 family
MPSALKHRGALSWALYDWANSAWATTVLAGFFPIFLKDYWGAGLEPAESTFRLGLTVSIAGLVVAFAAPVLGALADSGAMRKRLLLLFAGLGIMATLSLAAVGKGDWPTALVLFALSNIGFLAANIFYDALLINVSDSSTVDMLSGLGFALGYLGGGLLFAFNVVMTLHPDWFGLVDGALVALSDQIASATISFDDARQVVMALDGSHSSLQSILMNEGLSINHRLAAITELVEAARAWAIKFAFVSVGIWWCIWTLPLAFRVPECAEGAATSLRAAVRQGMEQLAGTVRAIRGMREIGLFLAAYWCYIDGVNTVVVMAVDYGKNIGITTADLITILLIVQFVAFPFAWAFGKWGQRYGTRRFLFVGIAVYLVVTVMARQIDLEPWRLFGFSVHKFFVLAFLIGTVQGGVQALSRSFYARLIPPEQAAEYFGFYNMVGKFAAVVGPTLIGSITLITGDPRTGVASIGLLFIGGLILLLKVREPKKA